MTATFLIGDARARAAELADGSFDLVLCSPPFLDLRSYLPDGHPDKALEIGSEADPAEFLTVLLDLAALLAAKLAPHGSLVFELGDTYSDGAEGWPLDKSLAFIPHLFGACLAYGRNLLTGEGSPAGRWRVRNLKPWIRSNPPVGALGDKERPATSYVVVATRARDRYFDLDAVRSGVSEWSARYGDGNYRRPTHKTNPNRGDNGDRNHEANPAGAPPLDWWHQADAIIDAEIDARAGKPSANRRTAKGVDRRANTTPSGQRDGNWSTLDVADTPSTVGARGVHIRRALERAGILRTLDALDVSPKGYAGAHYAVWPTQLVRLLLDEMCPRRVCTTCGQPSRRIAETVNAVGRATGRRAWRENGTDGVGAGHVGEITEKVSNAPTAERVTVGWSSCGHDTMRPGRILDPFVGSGTTLEVASGMGRDVVGIDLDARNAVLALERVGPLLLEVVWPPPDFTLPTLRSGSPHPDSYSPWARMTGRDRARLRHVRGHDDEPATHRPPDVPAPIPEPARRPARQPQVMAGQGDMFTMEATV